MGMLLKHKKLYSREVKIMRLPKSLEGRKWKWGAECKLSDTYAIGRYD